MGLEDWHRGSWRGIFPWKKNQRWEGARVNSFLILEVVLLVKVKLLTGVQLLVTPWTVAHQAPPSMEFSRQEYWSRLPFPSPGDLPDPGIEPGYPTLQADALQSEIIWNRSMLWTRLILYTCSWQMLWDYKLKWKTCQWRKHCSSDGIIHSAPFPSVSFYCCLQFSSVQFSHSVVSDSLRPYESQHARPPCPSPAPRVHSDSGPSSQRCHPAISSSVIRLFSCPQSLPASVFQESTLRMRWPKYWSFSVF